MRGDRRVWWSGIRPLSENNPTSPDSQPKDGFWGARQRYVTPWGKEICETVLVVGSPEPHIFKSPDEIDRVMNAVNAGLCRPHNDLSLPHRIYDDRGFGQPVWTAVILTERGKELLEQLEHAA